MEIETKKVKLSELNPNPDNPRQISKADMAKLLKSLQEFPEMLQIREIVVDENMMILGGNMRYQALKAQKVKDCEIKQVAGLLEAQKKEFVIKDNSSFGQWDYDRPKLSPLCLGRAPVNFYGRWNDPVFFD